MSWLVLPVVILLGLLCLRRMKQKYLEYQADVRRGDLRP
jgi:hypothetical protein